MADVRCYKRHVTEFRVLGPLEVASNGRPAHARRSEAAGTSRAAAHPRRRDALGRPDRRRALGREPAAHGDDVAAELRLAAAQARSAPDVLVTKPPGYVLHVDRTQLDLTRFEQLVAEARRAAPDERARLLREALALWRGPPLADFAYEAFAAGRDPAARGAAARRARAAHRRRSRRRRRRGARRRAGVARRALPAPRAAARPPDARALPLGSPGRSAERVPRGPRRARRRARHRAEPRAAAALRVDPAPGGGPRPSVAPAASSTTMPDEIVEGRARRTARARARAAARASSSAEAERRCAAGPVTRSRRTSPSASTTRCRRSATSRASRSTSR